MKVLLGVDGSAGAFAAAHVAGELLSATKDRVALYCAPMALHPQRTERLDAALVQRARESYAEAIFEEAKRQLPAELAAQAESIVGTQHAAKGLLIAAEQARAEMVVVGARGLGTLERLVLGSVSEQVAHHSHVPVLVARQRADGNLNRPLRVLLAYDGSDACHEAVDFLKQLSWPAQGVGYVVAVMESMFAGEIPAWLAEKARDADTEAMAQAWQREHEAEKAALLSQLRGLQGKLPTPFREGEPSVLEGNPAEQLLRFATREKIDLLIVGARGLGAWQRMMLGSTSAKILAHAPCSVLVVRKHVHA